MDALDHIKWSYAKKGEGPIFRLSRFPILTVLSFAPRFPEWTLSRIVNACGDSNRSRICSNRSVAYITIFRNGFVQDDPCTVLVNSVLHLVEVETMRKLKLRVFTNTERSQNQSESPYTASRLTLLCAELLMERLCSVHILYMWCIDSTAPLLPVLQDTSLLYLDTTPQIRTIF
jgi:hypothetical protein